MKCKGFNLERLRLIIVFRSHLQWHARAPPQVPHRSDVMDQPSIEIGIARQHRSGRSAGPACRLVWLEVSPQDGGPHRKVLRTAFMDTRGRDPPDSDGLRPSTADDVFLIVPMDSAPGLVYG